MTLSTYGLYQSHFYKVRGLLEHKQKLGSIEMNHVIRFLS